MTLSKTKVWSRRETSEQGEKLIKVIELGLHKPILATDIVGVVLQEVIEEHNRLSDNHVILDRHTHVCHFTLCNHYFMYDLFQALYLRQSGSREV